MLVPPTAPFLKGADLLVLADCVPVAFPTLHQDFLQGKAVMMGCPKFDDAQHYIEKFSQICQQSGIKSITAVVMEVPCCSGLVRLVKDALAATGKKVPLKLTQIGINGATLSESTEQSLYQENQR